MTGAEAIAASVQYSCIPADRMRMMLDLCHDLPLELPLSDYAARMNFIRCYHDLVPKRRPEFVWSDWKKYFTDKYSRKHRSDRPLPFDLDSSDFVSRQVLAELEGA